VGLSINPKKGRSASFDVQLNEMIRVFSKYGHATDIRKTNPEPASTCISQYLHQSRRTLVGTRNHIAVGTSTIAVGRAK
jgi:hypothetical protein